MSKKRSRRASEPPPSMPEAGPPSRPRKRLVLSFYDYHGGLIHRSAPVETDPQIRIAIPAGARHLTVQAYQPMMPLPPVVPMRNSVCRSVNCTC